MGQVKKPDPFFARDNQMAKIAALALGIAIVMREHTNGTDFFRKGRPRLIDDKDDAQILAENGLCADWPEDWDEPKDMDEANAICAKHVAEVQKGYDKANHEREVKALADDIESREKMLEGLLGESDDSKKKLKNKMEKGPATKKAEPSMPGMNT